MDSYDFLFEIIASHALLDISIKKFVSPKLKMLGEIPSPIIRDNKEERTETGSLN